MKRDQKFSIYNGAIDFYCPLKIDTKLNFGDLFDTIQKSVDSFWESYKKQIYSMFSDELDTAIKEQGIQARIKGNEFKRVPKQVFNDKKAKGDITEIAIDTTNNSIKLKITTSLDEYFIQTNRECSLDRNHSKEIYGELSTRSQGRIVLPPIELKLCNGTTSLLKSVLIIYKDKTAILRVTLPIENVGVEPLISNNVDAYIETAKTFYEYPIEMEGTTIDKIVDSYCRFLLINKKIKEIRRYKHITNVLIANYSEVFDDVKYMPSKVQEELYKILIAPVKEIEGVSYTNEAKQHIDENACYFKGLVYITSSMGKCVSIVDKSILNYATENFEQGKEYGTLISEMRRNVEFSITILLLKLVNDTYTFERMGTKNINLIKVKNDYNRDKIFISMLHDEVFGSVRDLTYSFEKNMTYFIDAKNAEDKRIALNEIIEGEHRNRTEQLQSFVSILSLAFASIFGLPAINETLTFIRKICWFIQGDIPYFSIDSCSFILWFLIVAVLSLYLFLKSKIKKYK